MKINRSAAILIITTMLIAAVGFVLADKYFLGEKDKKNILPKRSQVFCWQSESKTYEKAGADIGRPASYAKAGKNPKIESADLSGNGVEENYILQSGRLSITENGTNIWQTAPEWQVDDFILSDSNNDGVVDINLSVWKPGDFGQFKPFWIKENDMSVKNHFFIFVFKDGKVKAVWQSSNLSDPNCQILFADVDGEGKNELIALEGSYVDAPGCKGKYISVWRWNEWGFSNQWRSEVGEYEGVKIEQVGGRKCVAGF